MDIRVKEWVESSCHPDRAKMLLEAMALLVDVMGAEIEHMWVTWAGRRGTDSELALFANLQQHVLDATIQSIEQFEVTINEDVDFYDQARLTHLLAGLYNLDKTELSEELRVVLERDEPVQDKLIDLIRIVSLEVSQEDIEIIESVSDTLMNNIQLMVKENLENQEMDVEASTSSSLIDRHMATWTDTEDDVYQYYANKRPMGYSLSQYLGVFPTSFSDETDPGTIAKRALALYLFADLDIEQAEAVLSKLFSVILGSGKLEIQSCMALSKELARLK